MSPVAKSRSKDKSSPKAVKEQQQKAPSKLLTAPVNGGNSAYNPISGTFHSVETAPSAPSPASQSLGRFQSVDEQSGSSSGTAEYDSMSNNDSCSGESEDQKEKTVATVTPRLEAIPGSDTDKREKIRQKNERKHQRQKERRAQELHERCSQTLMSRKLETLSQRFVLMGFPSERATLALILNGGRVEESVAWLLEGGEDGEQLKNVDVGNNLKIDISDELAKIVEMEVKFKWSKQEVERAIVACEGDMEKAAESLKTQKQEQSAAPLKSEVAGEPSGAHGLSKVVMATQSTVPRIQVKAVNYAAPLQQKRDERDLSCTKAVLSETDIGVNRSMQPLRRPQEKAEWTRLQDANVVDKRWPNASASPSISYSLTAPLQVAVPPLKVEARYAVVGSEAKTALQTGTQREPVIVMQRPQSSVKQTASSTCVGLNAPPAIASGWHPNGVSNVEMMKVTTGGLRPNLQSMSFGTSSPSPALLHRQNQYQSFISTSMDSAAAGLGGRWTAGTSLGTASSSSPSSLAVPSSLGLFTGWGSSGSSGSSSPVDWSSTGNLMMQCDYASIDWSLESTPLRSKLGSSATNDLFYNAWATTVMGTKLGRQGINGGVCFAGLQDNGIAIDPSPPAGSHEWTSPFAGKDLFSLSRRFDTSPPM
uniref:UBA domain-containing protein n=2 Tax=Anthurium amnicola TaxID=1678845 RepID=A0A1D1XWF1_9ARAE